MSSPNTNVAGFFDVIKRADATPLYSYKTGGYTVASPAYANGTFYITSSDGYLYAFSPGGSRAAAPTTTVASPAQNGTVAYGTGSVTVTGTATGAAGISSVGVAIQAGGSTGPWYDSATNTWTPGPYTNPAAITATSTGATWSLTVPLMPGGGPMTVIANAVAAGGVADIKGFRTSFTSTPSSSQPVVSLAQTIAPPGGSTVASAAAFAPNEKVTFSLAGVALGSATANGNGKVPAITLTVPTNAPFGPDPLTASGKKSGKVSTTTIDVENAWVSLGYGGMRTNFEPNDTVLARVLHVGPGLFIGPAYFVPYPATAPVESSPAVFDDVAFFGNDAGTMNAVDTQLGSPVWQYATPSGMPIASAPAIDNGYLAFGSEDGTLYELAVGTGTLTGSIALGGELTSPAAANGTFFVASKNGTVSAVSETTGTLVWQKNVGTKISGSVAVDAATGLLLVGDDLGYVSGYQLADGTRVFHTEIGGALKDAPAIAGGVAYIGSSNGNVVALTESTGQKVWSYSEGSAIAATPVVALGEPGFTGLAIYVGSADGNVTALTQAGKLVWHVPFPSAVVGMAATTGNVVMVELANGIVGATRGPNDGFYFYQYQTTGSLDTSPAIVSGAVYVGSGAGGIYAFTPYGKAPLLRSRDGLTGRQRLLANGPKPPWAHSTTTGLRAVGAAASMIWSLAGTERPHLLTAPVRATPALRFHGGPIQQNPRTYAIFRQPPGSTMSAAYRSATAQWLARSAHLAGTYVDTTPFAARPRDADFAQDVARVATLEHWQTGSNTQVVVLTAPEAFGRWAGFCAYHGVTSGMTSQIVYAVVPYPNGASVCGTSAGIKPTGNVAADLALPTLARERAAMASDPLGTGWYDTAGRETSDFIAP
jgi:outer membrane protein assembly factor BamB